MITVPYFSVVTAIADNLNISPNDLTPEYARQWNTFINRYVGKGWKLWPWPDITATDERAFATIWNDTKQFRRENATTGAPDQLYYITTKKYYEVNADAGQDPPIGTLPTDEDYFTELDLCDVPRFIPYAQSCRRVIDTVIGVYGCDPRKHRCTPSIKFRPSERGIEVAGGPTGLYGPTVFVHYKIGLSIFTSEPYDATKQYKVGALVFWPPTETGGTGDGEVYRAVTPVNGNDPSTQYWVKVPFPAILNDYVAYKTASQAADDRQSKVDFDAQAEDAWRDEADKLIIQGQTRSYRLRRALAECERYPIGAANFMWVLGPEWCGCEDDVTTLTEICETEGGEMATGDQGGTTPLVIDQDYIDIEFGEENEKASNNWTFDALDIEYPTDPPPEKIGINSIVKSTTGARVYLDVGPSIPGVIARWKVVT